ncbi:MAG TPA: hypothetical protein VFC19_43705 [Candidatus Limnocylindrales bacterium]|nr:hypothetical protein [Candidatus Limnocylindrales bacterium]
MSEQHPLETVSSMRRRRFLGLAAFAGTSVIGVGVAGLPAEAAQPVSSEPEQQLHTIDKDTGWPIFSGAQPPEGYERHYLPCDHGQYVDVPVQAVTHSLEGVTVLHPPYRHEDWHRIPGGKS